jgi:hypothetical protein
MTVVRLVVTATVTKVTMAGDGEEDGMTLTVIPMMTMQVSVRLLVMPALSLLVLVQGKPPVSSRPSGHVG